MYRLQDKGLSVRLVTNISKRDPEQNNVLRINQAKQARRWARDSYTYTKLLELE